MKRIEVRMVREWDVEAIRHLYRLGGWWKEEWDPEALKPMIARSFAFAVGIDQGDGNTVAMGRVISDGVSDAYIQDVIVLPEYRSLGIGRRLVDSLVGECRSHGIEWIGLIAEPGTENFYIPAGFTRMEGYVPLLYAGLRAGGEERALEE